MVYCNDSFVSFDFLWVRLGYFGIGFCHLINFPFYYNVEVSIPGEFVSTETRRSLFSKVSIQLLEVRFKSYVNQFTIQ